MSNRLRLSIPDPAVKEEVRRSIQNMNSAFKLLEGVSGMGNKAASVPSAGTGKVGDMTWDNNFIYLKTGASTWKKAALVAV